MRFKVITSSELLREKTDDEYDYGIEVEAAYRSGYFDAIGQVYDALERGVLPRQLLAYYNNQLWKWRFSVPFEKIAFPPNMPEPWSVIRKRILQRDRGICHYCGEIACTVDHKIPVCYGGSDDENNLVACCKSCNSSKYTSSYESYMQQRKPTTKLHQIRNDKI